MNTQLTFQTTTLSAVAHNNQTYITASDLSRALQYKSVDAVTKIYTRNEDEFTADMSDTVKLTVSGNLQTTTRIFSLRGAHLIAMFARTPVAKAFRKWVLDILDKEVSQNPQKNLPLASPEKKFIHKLKNSEAVDIAWLWFEAKMMADFIKTITPALETLNSGYAPQAYSMGVEYGNHIHHLGKLIYRLTAEADFGHNPKPMQTLNATITPKKILANF